jgi:hypothetical protein
MALGGGLLALGFLFLLLLCVALIPEIFFLLNLQETLRRVSRENRRMTPGLVWLMFIPVFGLGWFIYTVLRITDSLRAEYRSRGWQPDGDFGYGVGLAAGILSIGGLVWRFVPHRAAAIGAVLSLGYLVCWIIYWVRTARMKSRLGAVTGWAGPGAGSYSSYGRQPGPGAWPPAGTERGQGWAPPYAGEVGPEPGGWNAPPPAGEEPPTDQAKRCSACGTTVTPHDKFCRGCGSTLP